MPQSTKPLPASVEELTDGVWLTHALRDSGVVTGDGDVEVTDTEPVGEGVAFACKLHRLHLRGPEGTPQTAVVKLPVTGEARAMLDGIGAYKRETVFYRTLAQDAPLRTPQVYAVAEDESSSDFVLVQEDLGGMQAVDQLQGFTAEQAEAVVDELARFHAWSWEQADRLERYADSFWPIDSPHGRAVQEQFVELFGMVWQGRRDSFDQLLGADAMAIGDRFGELLGFFISELASPRTITHGELRAENLFFDGQGRPVFFDFQVTQQECGVRELAYLLANSLRLEDAERLEPALLRRYWENLRAAGVEDYPWERAQEQYRVAVAYNLLWPVMASMRWEASSERGRAALDDMIRRAGEAIERQRSREALPIGESSVA